MSFKGFISLDCGLPPNESPYDEPSTGLTFSSDHDYIQSGKGGRIGKEWEYNYKQCNMLRFFPDGIRNCYNLTVKEGTNYLVRTGFAYGNYDGLNIYPRFNIYVGPNLWTMVYAARQREFEIIHMARSNSLDICLVKTGTTTPIISILELRPLRNDSYSTRTGSLQLVQRQFKKSRDLRYPPDAYDRQWKSYLEYGEIEINTTLTVDVSNPFGLPDLIAMSAAIPENASNGLTFTWSPEKPSDKHLVYLHFAEIQDLQANDTREFDILSEEVITYPAYSPKKLQVDTLVNTSPKKCRDYPCVWKLVRTPRSTLPPLFNAVEVYKVVEFPYSETYSSDVAAMKNIQAAYGLSIISWQGDPCVPELLKWKGVECSYTDKSIPPRIIALDLPSRGISGIIAPDLQNFTELQRFIGEYGASTLNWGSRLNIAADIAQGLEYLHSGCRPPLVHRDVKTTNIIIDEHFHAKLVDFGLSRSFQTEGETHISTILAGTPGYLDPEYNRTNWLTEKSDVYSFGIVLLEIITNQPVIDQKRENPHIAEWMGFMLTKGGIENIVDPSLVGDYDSRSMWKVLELAMSCVNPSSIGRPNMSHIVHQLKECLVYENSKKGASTEVESKSSFEQSMDFAAET
ncbi:unnamed protein product [Microthlaspi erraticum]|uniref:Protein kinase domain-containing protein n=1 Tax=Microthlaspi erraticum TaxID=1685480 RepID=A0A6D2HNL2_9BRAS|nr:unnamed protein product [Microthlaspi erraticum]